MISKKMQPMLHNSSAIRAMFEEGIRLAKEFGKENVYDFSLGNPNLPAPEAVKTAIIDILNTEDSLSIHGYMNNAGFEDVRAAIAKDLNKRYGTDYTSDNLIMTVGAATGLNISLKTILDPEDEVIVFAPYFVEYGNYVKNYDGKLVVIEANTKDFQPDLEKLESAITKRTKAIIINTPNNPTGVIYSKETLENLNRILRAKEKEYGITIVTISDEPYRELVYTDTRVEWVPSIVENTIVVYSFSKSLSLPGERIGYALIPSSMDGFAEFIQVIRIVNRVIGGVNAPSLMQKVIARCLEERADITYYDRNRQALYQHLQKLGFECIRPEGAFYLFMKAPVEEKEFLNICKKYNVLLVPGSAFGCAGYVRIAYCVRYEMIERSLPAFEKIARECGLGI